MAIEGFNYEEFAQVLSSQAVELVPANFQEFQKNYVVNTIKNFSLLAGEALYNDEQLHFDVNQAMLVTQIIAEWAFHKSVDVIKSGIMPDHWDGIMQKVAFTIFEIAKQAILQGMPQEEILQVVEHHVKKSYQAALDELKSKNIITEEVFDKASHQSNIDEMMDQLQDEKRHIEEENLTQQMSASNSSKILKLASVALLLKQVSQDKVQSILNKFNPDDAQTVIQYMQMQDLESKVDSSIAMRCLQEIKVNLPVPKYITPEKVVSRVGKLLSYASKEKVEKAVFMEREGVKDFVQKAIDGDYSGIPTKIASLICQHLEDNVS